MMMPMMYPPPRRSGTVWTALAVVGLVLSLGLNLLLILLLVVGAAFSQSEPIEKRTVISGDSSQTVAVVPISGVIMSDSSYQLERFLDTIENDKSVKAIVLEIDSPGGTVTAADEIHNRLKRLKGDRNLPIVAAMGSMATSGGYYVACSADHIIAQPTTLTGNIGVLMPRFNVHELMQEWGVEDATIASTGSDFKNAGSMFRPETPEERQYMQSIADAAFAEFKQVVQTGRAGKLKKPMEEVANGKVYTAREAQTLGLIDQVGYYRDAYNKAAAMAGLRNMNVVRYDSPPSLLQVLGIKSNTSPVTGGGNGLNINLDARLLHEFATPRLMYLWRGQ
jgi:protease IV